MSLRWLKLSIYEVVTPREEEKAKTVMAKQIVNPGINTDGMCGQLHCLSALNPGESLIAWVGLRAGLERNGEQKMFSAGNRNPNRPAIPTTLFRPHIWKNIITYLKETGRRPDSAGSAC